MSYESVIIREREEPLVLIVSLLKFDIVNAASGSQQGFRELQKDTRRQH